MNDLTNIRNINNPYFNVKSSEVKFFAFIVYK